MTKTTAQEIIDDLRNEGFDDQQILYALEDGAALADLGYTDDDQEAIEEAYEIIRQQLLKSQE